MLAACAAAGNAAFATAAHTVQMDAPSEALAAVAVAAALAACRGRTWLWAVTGACLGLAALTKFTALVAVLPVACIAAAGCPRAPGASARAWWIVPAALVGGACAAALPFLPTIAAPHFIAETIQYHVAAAQAIGSAPLPHLAVVGRFLAAAWPLTAVAAAGMWIARGAGAPVRDRVAPRPAWTWSIPAMWLLAELTALTVMTPLWPHHLVLLLSPLALLAGMGADTLLRAASRSPRALPGAVALLCVTAYLAAGVPGSLAPNQSAALRRAADVLARDVSPRGSVVTDDPLVPFVAGRRVPTALIDTSDVRIDAHALPEDGPRRRAGRPGRPGGAVMARQLRPRVPALRGPRDRALPDHSTHGR